MPDVRPSAGCLSDDELAAAAAGAVAASAPHLDRCEACRRAVSALALLASDPVVHGDDPTLPAEPPAAALAGELAPGQQIGRFTLTRKLGQGGMGQVWAARDPELEREVALKLLHLRTEELGAHGPARLRREAQAMARLSHPNVVAIYELGADGDRVFCAMELIDGVTLRRWLAIPRPWPAVIDVALAIGRGLAAAHAAGLVHRDIKPDNVLIARDGRILVTDFGLAKLVERAAADQATDEPAGEAIGARGAPAGTHATSAQTLRGGGSDVPARSAELTALGAVVGTPAYMPPEQLDGRRVDVQTDQFAYCVMIYEALFGARPFPGDTLDALADAMARGPVVPERGKVPRAVVRAVIRGLAHDPRDRWPSMPALLARFERIRARPRRIRLAIAGATAAALLGGAALAMRPGDRDHAGEVRAAAESRISAAWGPPQRAAIEARFGAAREELAVVTTVLDAYRADWLAMRVDAWAAHHVRKEQSAELLERRLACLDGLAGGLAALVEILTTADAAEIGRAPRIVHQLEQVASCAALHRLAARTPPPSTPAGKAAEDGLRAIEALQLAGRGKEALARAAQLVSDAEQLGDPGVLARAVHDLGIAQANAAHADAEATLRRAIQLAADAREHVLVAEAWLRLFSLTGIDQRRPQDAVVFEGAVRAAVAQAGNDPRQQAELAMTLGLVAEANGDLVAARGYFLEARERHVAARGPDHPHVAMADTNLGKVLLRLGELDEAYRRLERALASVRATMGETNPIAGPALQNLSAIAARRKDWPASEQHLRAAIVINRKIFGAAHPELARNYIFLARALRQQHQHAEAARELATGREIAEAALPAGHVMRAMLDIYDAQLAEARGRYADAVRLGRSGLAAVQASSSATSATIAFASAELARFLAHEDPAAALPLYEEALRLTLRGAARDPTGEAETLAELGRAALAAGRAAAALRWFERMPAAAATLPDLRDALQRAHRAGE